MASPEVSRLAGAARKLADLLQDASECRLDDLDELHRAMADYRRIEHAYLGLQSAADFIRADAERYEDPDTRGALERVAQLLERELDT